MAGIATRREKVILDLEDNFSSGMARAAASTALLDKSLNSLSGSAVRSRRDLDSFNGSTVAGDHSINQFSGRVRILVDALATIGPAAAPIGAAVVPALSGMATQLGLVVAAAGVAALAFQGVGDGLSALNDYQLEPSQANLEKVQLALEKIGPAGAEFVQFLDSVGPKFSALQMTAREGMFPGIQEGIENLLPLLPRVDRIVREIAEAMGQLASDAGAGLSGAGFRSFFDYLKTDAQQILLDLGHSIGGFAEGLANLVVALGPVTADFSGGLLEMSRSFAEWTSTLSENQSFQDFLSYVQEASPKVIDLVGSIADAFVAIARAIAPVGDVVLPIITKLFDAIAEIAGSPLGSVFFAAAAGLTAYTRAASLAVGMSARLGLTTGKMVGPFNTSVNALRTGAAVIGMTALSFTDLDDNAGLANTAMLGMAGTMAGPWGAAAGIAVGLSLDLAAANDDLAAAVERAERAFDDGASVADQKVAMEALREEIAKTKSEMDFSDALKGSDGLQAKALWNVARAGFLKLGGSVDEAEAKIREFKEDAARAGNLGPLFGVTSESARQAASSVDQLAESFQHLDDIIANRASLIAYERSLDDLRKKLEEPGKSSRNFNVNFERGRQQLEAINNVADVALRRSEQLKKVGDDLGSQRILQRATGDLRAFANDFPKAQGYIRGLIRELKDLDGKEAKPKADLDDKSFKEKYGISRKRLEEFDGSKWFAFLDVDPSGAIEGARAAQAAINGVVGKTVTITVNRAGAGVSDLLGNALGGADGMTVPGPRYPYGDKILAHLAPGEEVISNRYGQADQFRADRAAGRIPAYADGGMVQRAPLSAKAAAMHVTFGDVQLGGTLRGGGFMAQIEGIARAAARSEAAADRRHNIVKRGG